MLGMTTTEVSSFAMTVKLLTTAPTSYSLPSFGALDAYSLLVNYAFLDWFVYNAKSILESISATDAEVIILPKANRNE